MGHFVGAVLSSFPLDSDADPERESRSQSEWFDAVIGYLEFRAGSRWRRGRPQYRNAARYLEYLDALRLLQISRYHPAQRIEPVLPALGDQRKPPQSVVNRIPWTQRPWDHFACCRCPKCRSLRARGIDPSSTDPRAGEKEDMGAA